MFFFLLCWHAVIPVLLLERLQEGRVEISFLLLSASTKANENHMLRQRTVNRATDIKNKQKPLQSVCSFTEHKTKASADFI